jgi:2,4-dienoyl-CoA reductase-like NADH-dependent reductase (Old Yellow Enzyme family)
MSERTYTPIGGIRSVAEFKAHVASVGLSLPCDDDLETGTEAPLAQTIAFNGKQIGNRFCIHPMEGWDALPDGQPSECTVRRWRNFGLSGAKLIWGGEAVAVRHEGRANPNQLLINEHTKAGIARLRETLIAAHEEACGNTDDLLVGLQLTHSGRYSCPNEKLRGEPRILYHHPFLDARVKVDDDYPLLGDGDIRRIIEDFHVAARTAWELGFDFVDVKHCHGYLGHEFLSAHTRGGDYGGSFANRTRFLREVVEGIRSVAPGLQIGVRLSAFDTVPFTPDPAHAPNGKIGVGVPESYQNYLPYVWGFDVDAEHPEKSDLTEGRQFLSLLRDLDIRLVNISGGSPYYNPHLQRPALYPPSDGYQPPEDPLVGVARQMEATRALKESCPDLIFVGSGYTYLQEFLPFVAQAAVREGWVDSVGLGRMVLSYPELPIDVISGAGVQRKRICRTFSDCTTAPRNGLPSGCYPLDDHYKGAQAAIDLKEIKAAKRRAAKNGHGP